MQTFRLPARGTCPPFFFLSPKDGRQTCRAFTGTPLECTECNCIHVPEKSPTSLFLPSCYSSPAPSSIQIQPDGFLFYFLRAVNSRPWEFLGGEAARGGLHIHGSTEQFCLSGEERGRGKTLSSMFTTWLPPTRAPPCHQLGLIVKTKSCG